MRKKATVRELHLKTSDIIKEVANGGSFVIEKHGRAVAVLRPVSERRNTTLMPDREGYFGKQPRDPLDSGRILEEDRS
jgi:prevent-host-death family protein